jgi:two-component system response regulator YesN
MKKIVVVDDEIIVREGIRNRVDWQEEGFVYCGDAEDGEIALPLIERTMPDIVITDIKMPFMDGLQLSKLLRHKMPAIKIIIMSGHDEFEYAREAIRIGITEYCLKPVSSSDLLQTLHAVSKQIDSERKKQQEIEALQLDQQRTAVVSKEKLLHDLCCGSISAAEAMEACTYCQIDLISPYYKVLVTELDSRDSTAVHGPSELEHALQTFKQFMTELGVQLHFQKNKKEWVWILKSDQEETLHALVETIKQRKISIEAASHCRLNIGVGSTKARIQDISHSFMEADEELTYAHMVKKYQLIQIRGGTNSLTDFEFDRNQLLDFLKIGTLSKVKDFTTQYAADLEAMDWSHSFYGYYFLMDITVTSASWLKMLSVQHEEVIEAIENYQKKIPQIRAWSEALSFIETIVGISIQFRIHIKETSSSVVQKAKDYIHVHYDRPEMSLQAVASYVNMSSSYFSTLFSQETGQTFIDYLTQTRMKKAMELLKSSNAKSYEIAYQVGYSDANYFSNLFKKVTGMTTKSFRRED